MLLVALERKREDSLVATTLSRGMTARGWSGYLPGSVRSRLAHEQWGLEGSGSLCVVVYAMPSMLEYGSSLGLRVEMVVGGIGEHGRGVI